MPMKNKLVEVGALDEVVAVLLVVVVLVIVLPSCPIVIVADPLGTSMV